MKERRIGYGVLLLSALVIYILSNRKETLFFLCALLAVAVLSFCLQLAAMQGIEADIRLRTSCQAGQVIPLNIVIRRKNRLPLGAMQMQLTMENKMYRETREENIYVKPEEKQEICREEMLLMKDCGSVYTTLVSLNCQDFLGIFQWKKKLEKQTETLVYPAQLQVHVELTRRPETKTSGELYDPYRKGQDVSEVAGLRGYAEGDSLGSIHWKLSSKLDNLIVREFACPANYSVLILYDVMKNTDGTPIDNERNNAVLALTAALSEGLIRMGLEHTVGSISSGDYQDLPVYSMETQEQMLYHLLYRPVAEKRNAGDTMYHFLRSNLKNTYTKLVYITPEYEESVIRQAAREVDLTMIPVVSRAEASYADAREYTVLPVDAEKYREQVHHMII